MSTTQLTATVGKTVASVTASEADGPETITIAFTDGTVMVLTAEAMGAGCACISSVVFKAPA